jgi:hypothetical protein
MERTFRACGASIAFVLGLALDSDRIVTEQSVSFWCTLDVSPNAIA